MVQTIAEGLSRPEIDAGIDGYLALGGFLDQGLKQQTQFDLEALERATGRTFTEVERAEFMTAQHQANRWTYIGSGMSHPRFLDSLQSLNPAKREMIEGLAPTFS
jgi:hypothetical protein